jgi:hypothetical protein
MHVAKKNTKNKKHKISERTKPIGMIGDPDNQLPDKWNSTVFCTHLLPHLG